MTNYQTTTTAREKEHWLKRYYFARSVFSIIWVAAALTAGRQSFTVAAVLLLLYPAWDAIANFAGYAGLGAFYFLISATWLAVGEMRLEKTLPSSRTN